MSITIEVSEEIEAAIRATPDGLERVRQLLESEFGSDDDETQAPLDDETLESIGRGLAQADAGELIDGDEVLAELYAAVGLPDPPTINRDNPRRRAA